MNSQSPSATRSESPTHNDPGPSFIGPPSTQLSDTFPLDDGDKNNFPQEEEEEENDDDESEDKDYERTCAICHKSSLKGDRGLRVHQRVSKECLRIMRDTQQMQPVVSSSDRNEEEDEFSVASYRSNASSNELVDFMDDFIGKISQLAQNRVNVVHVQVPKAFVDTLRYLNNEIFNRETFKHIINRLATVTKKVAVAFGRLMFHIVVFVFVVILFRQILYHSVNLWMHIMFKEEAPAVIHEFWTRLQNRPPLF